MVLCLSLLVATFSTTIVASAAGESAPKAEVIQVVDQSVADGNIRTLVTTEDTIATNTTVSGVIYVDGEISTTASLFKYSASNYAVFVTSPVAGTTVRIGGVYAAGENSVEFKPVNFVYDGTNWRITDKDAADPTIVSVELDVTGQADKAMWLNASPQDGLPYADNWSCQYRPVADAGLFVNGTRYAAPLIKVFENTYLIPADYFGFEVQDKTEVIIKGFFCDAKGNGPVIEEVTFVYHAEKGIWLKAGAKLSADVDDEDYVDFNIVRKSYTNSKTDAPKDEDQKTDTVPQPSNNSLLIIISIIAVVAVIGVGGIFILRKQRRRNKE